jgi:hypothetical protein
MNYYLLIKNFSGVAKWLKALNIMSAVSISDRQYQAV